MHIIKIVPDELGVRLVQFAPYGFDPIPAGFIEIPEKLESKILSWIEAGYTVNLTIETISQTTIEHKLDEGGINYILDENLVPAEFEVTRDVDVITAAKRGVKVQAPEPPTQDFVQQTHQLLHQALEIPMLWKDGGLYTVTAEKQNLLSGQLGIAALAQEAGISIELEWNQAGQECTIWAFENLFALALSIMDYVRPLANAQRRAEVLINATQDPNEIQAILDKYKATLDDLISQQERGRS